MPRKAKELTALAVGKLKMPGLHFVGGAPGLALQVLPKGGRTWILRYMLDGRRRDMGLGSFDDVGLADARDLALAKRKLFRRDGAPIDPIEARRAAKAAAKAAQAETITFKDAADRYIKAHAAGWKSAKHAAQWTATLEAYAYPVLGPLSVGDVALGHVLQVLEPIWQTKTETASRLRGRVESVLDWARVRGYRTGENPARWKGNLDKLLARRPKQQHHTALAVGEIGPFMERLRTAEGLGAKALEFAILTAARSGEVRGATWAEIDLEAKVWTVPAGRMKAGREHRVPLSQAALAVLEGLPRMGGTDLVFPAPRGGQLSDMTISAVCRRMNIAAVPHGFRSTFSDWCAERTAYASEVREMALAHTVGDKVEAAYRRGDLFDKRRRLMADWAAFLAKAETSPADKVVSIREVA